VNTSDKYGLLGSYCADANLGGLAGYANVADVDIVTTGGEVKTGIGAECDVV
jgi:hypothetical protein